MKTLTELRDRPFYRFLKVLYFIALVPVAFALYFSFKEGSIELFAYSIGWIAILSGVKKLIYYIFLGSFNPSK